MKHISNSSKGQTVRRPTSQLNPELLVKKISAEKKVHFVPAAAINQLSITQNHG